MVAISQTSEDDSQKIPSDLFARIADLKTGNESITGVKTA
jgi:hypothetical protein